MATPKEQTLPAHSVLPWRAEVGERLSDGSDCWVIDSEENSIAEMMCPADVEEANAKLIVRAVNAHDALVDAAKFVKAFLLRLEDGLPEDDPLTKARRKYHAPIHAKLDAALALAEKDPD